VRGRLSRRRAVAATLLAGGAFAGLSCAAPVSRSRPPVAASIFPLYDIALRVAGPDAEVALVLPPGQTDHAFDPRPQEVARLAGLELAFGVGLGLDPWLNRLVAAATDGRARVVELAPALEPLPLPSGIVEGAEDEAHGAESALDPHVFLDPRRMAQAALLMGEALAARDPGHAAGYHARARSVREALEDLDREIQARSEAWRRKTIVTFHGSFFYFAARYGLTVAAVVETRPGREPSPRYVTRVVQRIRETGTAALFTEPQLDPVPARIIAGEAGVPLFELDPIGGGPGAQSYEDFLRKNAAVLDEALR